MATGDVRGEFVFEPSASAAVGSVLHGEHLKLIEKSRLADFAGYLMPLWYSSISAEHAAVRQAAGVFDCTHMGILEVSGPDAVCFLNSVTTNEIGNLTAGRAQYSYILDAAGNILDDIIVYARDEENFMVVVNAANELKIKAYFSVLQSGDALVDIDRPDRKLDCIPVIRDMRDTSSGSDARVDIAVQGPASVEVLFALITEEKIRWQIKDLKPFHFIEADIAGAHCIVSTTGYTGAKVGFELFVHPDIAAKLWNMLLEKGRPFGLQPCGLGARDSLRIEAGLPLYGHELAGEYKISPIEAGYGWAVKMEKQFFIGKSALLQKSKVSDMNVVRVELPGEKGVRPARANDAIVDAQGICIGWVLSCAKAGEKQIALGLVKKGSLAQKDSAGLYYLARSSSQIKQGKKESVQKAEAVKPDITGIAVSRFEKF